MLSSDEASPVTGSPRPGTAQGGGRSTDRDTGDQHRAGSKKRVSVAPTSTPNTPETQRRKSLHPLLASQHLDDAPGEKRERLTGTHHGEGQSPDKRRMTIHENDPHHKHHHPQHHHSHHHSQHGHHHHGAHGNKSHGSTTNHGSQAVFMAIEAIAEAKAQRKSAIAGVLEDGNPDALSESAFSDGEEEFQVSASQHWKRFETYHAMSAAKKMEQHEAREELREFLKVVRPGWSLYDRHSVTNIDRVMDKLAAIGVYDISGLMQRVYSNSINMDLSQMGFSRFDDDTLLKLRTAKSFLRAMNHLKEPFYRQTGNFAQVRQLLAKTNLWNWDERLTASPTHSQEEQQQRPSSSPASDPGRRLRSKTRSPSKSEKGRSPSAHVQSETDLEFTRPRRTRESNAFSIGQRIRHQKGYAKAAQHANLVNRKSVMAMPEAVLSSSAMDHPQLRYLTRPSSSSNPAQIPAYSEFAEMNRSQSSRPFSPAASLSQTPSQRGGVTAVVDRLSESYDGTETPAQRTKLPLSPMAFTRTKSAPSDTLGEGQTTANLEVEVERIQQAGGAMSVAHRKALWSNLRADNLHTQAEAMLEEQFALDERTALFKLMEREGLGSPTRQVIAGNIKSRLKDIATRDVKLSSDVHMRTTNIRNHLQQMLAARRDLRNVRRSTQALLKEDDRARVIESFKKNALIQPGALAGVAQAALDKE